MTNPGVSHLNKENLTGEFYNTFILLCLQKVYAKQGIHIQKSILHGYFP